MDTNNSDDDSDNFNPEANNGEDSDYNPDTVNNEGHEEEDDESDNGGGKTNNAKGGDDEYETGESGDEDSLNFGPVDGETIKEVGERLVPLSSTWKSKEDLKQTLTRYGLACGFQICSSGWSFTCNKFGSTRDRTNENIPEDKKRKGSRHLKVGCTMCVKFTFMQRKISANSSKTLPDKSGNVRVTFVNYQHTNCDPSPNQLVVAKRASGKYSELTTTMINSLLTVMEHDPGISTRALRAILRPAYPSRKHVSAQEIFNMKIRLRLMNDKKRESGEESLGKYKASLAQLFKGLDNEDSNVIDNASKHVHSILRSVLNSSEEGWKLLAMLEKMHSADPGFTFRVCKDPNGCPTGVIWMTPQMRSAFELFGNFVSIDAMKRQQNSHHWPYIGPVVLDENKTVAVIAESIMTAERHVAYEFVLNAIFDMAPRRHRSQVNIKCH